jgi:hypothetical protein
MKNASTVIGFAIAAVALNIALLAVTHHGVSLPSVLSML